MQAQSAAALRLPSQPAPLPPQRERVNVIGVAKRFDRDQEVYGEGDSADYVYKVVSGAVRQVRVLADGRRQISEFYLPGDVFGVEAGLERRSSAEALAETVVVVARRSSLTADPEAAQALWGLAMSDLERSRDHVLTLGRRAAAERVASFLLELANRVDGGDIVELPMSRQDMADYLGLTIETVSRTLTQLQGQGLIEIRCCRQIRLARRAALAELCE